MELHELETVVVDELIHGDVMDEVRGDPNPRVVVEVEVKT